VLPEKPKAAGLSKRQRERSISRKHPPDVDAPAHGWCQLPLKHLSVSLAVNDIKLNLRARDVCWQTDRAAAFGERARR
jgi:hypothetical protein